MNYSELVKSFGFDLWPISDRRSGKIGSAMPAWYKNGHIEEEYRNLDNQKAMIERGNVPPENLHRLKMQVAKQQHDIDIIKESFPRLTEEQKNRLYPLWKELGETLTQSMFTYTDMQKGAATPHEELRRAKDPVIPVSRPLALWIIYCNGDIAGNPGNYKMKRDDGVRAWRIAGRILGESTWSEDLRPMERPEGARRGEYDRIFTGFDREERTKVEITSDKDEIKMTDIDIDLKEEKRERKCDQCGISIENEHRMAKRCPECREKLKQEKLKRGREDTNKRPGGNS